MRKCGKQNRWANKNYKMVDLHNSIISFNANGLNNFIS